MANQRLFITEYAHKERVGNSLSTTYCYNQKGQLTIFWKGEKVAERTGVKPGDAFIVSCNGSEPTISRLKVPHRNDDLLMWLLSFNKGCRAYSKSEYDELLDHQRDSYSWWNYREWRTEGEGYAFTRCNRSDCGGVHHIAAFVEVPVTKELVKDVLQNWGRFLAWPTTFVDGILRSRFGFTDADFSDIGPLCYDRINEMECVG